MKTRQRGVAVVEFALILPFLLLLTIITVEFGRALHQYNTIVKSVRGTVRYLSVQTPNTHIAEAKNLVVFGNTSGTGPALVTGLEVSNVDTPIWAMTGSDPLINTVTVTVSSYTFHSMFASVFGVTFGDIPFSPIKATMRTYS